MLLLSLCRKNYMQNNMKYSVTQTDLWPSQIQLTWNTWKELLWKLFDCTRQCQQLLATLTKTLNWVSIDFLCFKYQIYWIELEPSSSNYQLLEIIRYPPERMLSLVRSNSIDLPNIIRIPKNSIRTTSYLREYKIVTTIRSFHSVRVPGAVSVRNSFR